MRSRLKIAAVAVAVLTGTAFFSTTSFALYRSAVGPARCCKSHCPHPRAAQESAKRCCSKHTTPPPAATNGAADPSASLIAAALPAVASRVAEPPCIAPVAYVAARSSPPAPSLFAQHTSLVR